MILLSPLVLNCTASNKLQQATSEGDFLNAMQDLHSDDEAYEADFLPFMQNVMQSLLSKEMMYPSLKEMTDKVSTSCLQFRYTVDPPHDKSKLIVM